MFSEGRARDGGRRNRPPCRTCFRHDCRARLRPIHQARQFLMMHSRDVIAFLTALTFLVSSVLWSGHHAGSGGRVPEASVAYEATAAAPGEHHARHSHDAHSLPIDIAGIDDIDQNESDCSGHCGKACCSAACATAFLLSSQSALVQDPSGTALAAAASETLRTAHQKRADRPPRPAARAVA